MMKNLNLSTLIREYKLARLARSLSAVIGAVVMLTLIMLAAQAIAQGTVFDPATEEPLLQVIGNLDSGRLGHAVASGDVNGDGYDDLLVSAPRATVISGSIVFTESGAVYLYLGYEGMSGTLNLSDTTPNLTFFSDCRDPGCPEDWAGSDLAIGDMNGDGMGDIMISVEKYHGAPGAVFVFVGRNTLTSGTHITLDIQTRALSTEWGYSLGGIAAEPTDRLGTVASGDVNGDTYDDMIMGAYFADPYTGTSPYYPDQQDYHGAGPFDRTNAGLIYVSAGWGALTKTAELPAYDYHKCLDSMTVYGKDSWDFLGYSIASGDLDGDGYKDILAGAFGGDYADPQGQSGDNSGEVYVFWGTDIITRVIAHDTIFGDCEPWNSSFKYTKQIVIDLAYTTTVHTNGITVGHSSDITIYGAYAGGGAGYDVSSGDLNGDGYDDLVIGAPSPDTSGQPGWVHIVYGRERGSLAKTMLLSETADLTIVGANNDDRLGESVSAADLNGDGYDDLIIGAIEADYSGRSNAGKSYVIYGTGGDGLRGTIYLSETHAAQITFVGENAEDGLGKGLGAGDLNHDGILDLLVGAPFFDPGDGSYPGTLYALAGDSAQGVTLTGQLDTVTAGEPATYTLQAWNRYGDWNVTPASSFTLQTGAGGSCAANVCTPTVAGTWTVSGTYQSLSDTTSLTVEPAALDYLVLTPSQATLDPGETQQFNAQGYDIYDNAISGLTYDWSVLDNDAGSIDSNGLFTADRTGSYDAVVQVKAGSVTDTADVTVRNLVPTAIIQGAPLSGFEGSPVNLDGSPSYDTGGSIVSYAWDWDYSGSFGADDTGVTSAPTYPDDAVLTVALRVTDNSGSSDVATTTLTIANVAPSVTVGGPYATPVTQTVTLTSAVSDPGNDTFTYAWDLDDDGQFDDASGPTAVFSPTAVGLFTVTLQVTDDDGGIGTGQTLVVVDNVAPHAVIANAPLSEFEGSPLTFDASDSYDVADTIVAYAWDWEYDGSFAADATGVSASHTWPDDASFVVALWVTDTQGLSDLTTTTVSIANVPPTVVLGGPYTTPLTQTVTLTSAVTDPGADTFTYAWDLDDDGQFDDAFAATAVYSPTVSGDFTITLRIRDDDGGETLGQTVVTVEPIEHLIFLPLVLRDH